MFKNEAKERVFPFPRFQVEFYIREQFRYLYFTVPLSLSLFYISKGHGTSFFGSDFFFRLDESGCNLKHFCNSHCPLNRTTI